MQRARIIFLALVASAATVWIAGCSAGVSGQAQQMAQQGSYEQAIALYEQTVAEKPGTPDAWNAQLQIGSIYRDNLNQPDKAMATYQAVADAAPTSEQGLSARYAIALLHFANEDYDTAAPVFQAIVTDAPTSETSADAQLMLAKTYERAGKLEEAQETFGAFSLLHSEDKNALIAMETRARILDQLGKKTEAITQRQKIVEDYGANPEAQEVVQLATTALRDEGAKVPDPITEANRSDAEKRRERLENVRERDRPRSSLEQSAALVNQNVFGQSADDIMRSMQVQADEQGTMHDAMFTTANAMYLGEQFRQAGALYQRSIELAQEEEGSSWDSMGAAYKGLADVYRKLGLADLARQVLQEAIQKDNGLIDQIIVSGQFDYGVGDYQKAIETWSFVAGMNALKDAEIYYKIGLAHKHLENTTDEVASMERAVAANPRNLDAVQSLAEVLYYRAGQRKRSYLYQDLIEEKAGWETHLEVGKMGLKYGYSLAAQQQFTIGARVAERAAKLADTTGDAAAKTDADAAALGMMALKSVATVQRNRDQMTTAKEEIAASVAANPENALIRYAAARIALLDDDLENAVPEYQKAIDLDPRNPDPVEELANLYIAREDVNAAVGVYTAYLEKNPRDRRIQGIRDNLEAQASSARAMQ